MNLLKSKTNELKRISTTIKCEIIKNPGLTNNEIISHFKGRQDTHLASIAIRMMRDTGTIIVHNGKYYVHCPSAMVKARRHRKKARENLLFLRENHILQLT